MENLPVRPVPRSLHVRASPVSRHRRKGRVPGTKSDEWHDITRWVHRLACCAAGHVTIPTLGRGAVGKCIRDQNCRQPIVMLADHPAVMSVCVIGGFGSLKSEIGDADIFQMLVDLKAWGDTE